MISSTAAYALRAIVFLAGQQDRFAKRSSIAEATLVPYEYLLKVLNQLESAELIESRSGPGGGYRMLKSAKEMTAYDVVTAIDDIPRITRCPLGIASHERLCPLHQLLDDASRHVEDAFRKTRIHDLLPRKSSRNCDFPQRNPDR